MIVSIEYDKNKFSDLDLFFHHEFKGHGTYAIKCEIKCNGVKQTKSITTHEVSFIDEIRDLQNDGEPSEVIQAFYLERFEHEFDELLKEIAWTCNVD